MAFLVGLGLHAVDQAVAFRAGPVPALVTAPVVATLVYRSTARVTTRRLAGLVTWGLVGSGAAVVAVYLTGVSYVLPRPLTGLEQVLYDAGLFLWFVLALTAAYAVAARTGGRRAVLAVACGPLVQAAFALLPVVLVAVARAG